MEYLIREVRENEIGLIVELCQKHAAHERMTYNPIQKKELLKKAIFSEVKQLYCFVIESNCMIVGYFTYTFDFSTWDASPFLYLDCLYIEAEFRGMGIGKTIIDRLREIGRKNDCVNIQWQTPIFNENAIEFYRRIRAIEKQKLRFTTEL